MDSPAPPTIGVTLKLYASLGRYLPPEAQHSQLRLDLAAEASPAALLAMVGLPRDLCHLVLLNGEYLPAADMERASLKDGDALAIWPPVAGG